MSNWKTYLSEERVNELLEKFNSKVGEYRKVNSETADAILASAAEEYSYLQTNSEIANALEWDLYGFLEFSTTGINASGEFYARYADHLSDGHPMYNAQDVQETVNWILADNSLEVSHKEAITAACSSNNDTYTSLHASARLKAILASGSLPPTVDNCVRQVVAELTSN